MKYSIKRFIVFSLISTLLLIPNSVYAENTATENQKVVEPMFTYISYFLNSFDISSSGNVTVNSNLRAQNVNQVKIYSYLQQYKSGRWQTIKNWSVEKHGISCNIGSNYYVVRGYDYRLISIGYAYKNGSLVESSTYQSKITKF